MRELLYLVRIRTAKRFRPYGPAPDRAVLAVEMLLQRFEKRVAAQPLTMARLELAERPAARRLRAEVLRAEMAVRDFQQRQLERRDCRIVHELGGADRLERRVKLRSTHRGERLGALTNVLHGFHVDIEDVHEEPRGRAVGACVRGIVGKERVQRVHARDPGAAAAPLLHEPREIRKVAHAPVAFGTHTVKLHRGAPDAGPGRGGRGEVTALGSHDKGEPLALGHALAGQGVPVIAARQRVAPLESDFDARLTIDIAARHALEVARPERPFQRARVFKLEGPVVSGLRVVLPEMEAQAVRPLVDPEHGDCREWRAPRPGLFLAQRSFRIGGLIECAERAQEGTASLAGRTLGFPPDIVVFTDDAV
jgi:hypothetical protein